MDQQSLFAEFEVAGIWWVPGSEHKVKGKLHYSPTSVATLKMDGVLEASDRDTMLDGMIVVHGEDRSRKPWTLLKAFEQTFNPERFDGNHTTSTVIASYLVSGVHLLSLADLKVDLVELSFPGLAKSLKQGSNITSDLSEIHDQITIKWQRPSEFALRLEGSKVVLSSHWYPTYSGSSKETSLRECPILRLKFDEATSYELIQPLIMHLRNLLITLHGMPCPILDLSIENPLGPGNPDIKAFFGQSCSSNFPTDPLWINMLVPLFKISPETFDSVITKWFELSSETKFAVNWFCGLVLLPTPYNHIDFVNLVQSLESLHRSFNGDEFLTKQEFKPVKNALRERLAELNLSDSHKEYISTTIGTANRYPQKGRLVELFNYLPGELGSQVALSPESFAQLVVNTRNYATHLDPKAEKKSMTAEEVTFANFGLKVFFRMLLLNAIGIDSKTILEGLKHHADFQHFRSCVPWDKRTLGEKDECETH